LGLGEKVFWLQGPVRSNAVCNVFSGPYGWAREATEALLKLICEDNVWNKRKLIEKKDPRSTSSFGGEIGFRNQSATSWLVSGSACNQAYLHPEEEEDHPRLQNFTAYARVALSCKLPALLDTDTDPHSEASDPFGDWFAVTLGIVCIPLWSNILG
jgi:hypothetical protein